MPNFSYIAITTDKKKVSGSISAGDRGEALKRMEKNGLRPLQLTETKEKGIATLKNTGGVNVKSTQAVYIKPEVSKATQSVKVSSPNTTKKKSSSALKEANAKRLKDKRLKESTKIQKEIEKGQKKDDNTPLKLKRKEVILFTEELSDMLAAGLQLEPALKSMENRQQKGNLQKVSEKVRSLVRDGTPFSKAIHIVSPSFGPLYENMAAAGEASGALDTILKRQVIYLKTLGELQNKVILAMIYPAFLAIAGIGVGIIFVTTLIPQLASLLDSIPGATMPAGAAFMLSATAILKKWWWVLIILILIAFLIFKGWKDKEENKPIWDRIKLRIPLVGAVSRDRFFVQFLETMSNLVANGLTLLRSLDLTKNATQNLHYKEELSAVIERIGDGRSLSGSLKQSGEFPDLLIDMVIGTIKS